MKYKEMDKINGITILARAPNKNGRTMYYCLCHCGSMKQICYNKNLPQYKDYGGRGIKVCDEWLNDFMAFYNWSTESGDVIDL